MNDETRSTKRLPRLKGTAELAARVGCSTSELQRVRKGVHEPRPKLRMRLVEAGVEIPPRKTPQRLKKPPIGLVPRFVSVRNRVCAILDAMRRYAEVGKAIPIEWRSELAGHLSDNEIWEGGAE
jgi:hypothetical protein